MVDFTRDEHLFRKEGIVPGGQQGKSFGTPRDQTSTATAPTAPGQEPFNPFAGFHFPSFDFGSFGGEGGQSSADFQAQLNQQREDDRINQGRNDRDDAFANRLDAQGAAVDFINGQIADERSNAALIGVDFSITDEVKTKRVSDYFASIFGEGEESRLNQLIGDFGNPSGFNGTFDIQRGDASTVIDKEGSEETVSTSSGQRPGTLATEDDDIILGAPSTLGQQSLLG